MIGLNRSAAGDWKMFLGSTKTSFSAGQPSTSHIASIAITALLVQLAQHGIYHRVKPSLALGVMAISIPPPPRFSQLRIAEKCWQE